MLIQLLLQFLALIIALYATRTYILTIAGSLVRRRPHGLGFNHYPFITILVPSHNEGVVIARTVNRLLELDYPPARLEILIINDASTDKTAEILDAFVMDGKIKALHRRPPVRPGGTPVEALAYPANGKFYKTEFPLVGGMKRGKSAAISSALKYINPQTEFIVLFDADHYPERTFILHDFMRHLHDPQVCIVQGDVRTINANTNVLTRFVATERDGANIDQNGRSVLGAVPQHSGTAAAIRLSFLQEIGGWDEDALCDDTDITFAAILRGYRIVYDPSIVSWEEGVDNLRAYWRQRSRWARGHMRVFFKYWRPVLFGNLSIWQKIDGFLLLAYYFVPLGVGVSLCLTLLNLLVWHEPTLLSLPAAVVIYCFPALFLQLGCGLLYRRVKVSRFLTLFLLPVFSLFNIVICYRALLMELLGIQRNTWVKTQRKGQVMNDLDIGRRTSPVRTNPLTE